VVNDDPVADERERGLATQFESAEDSPGLLLWQATHRWQAQQRAALKPLGLTHVQFVLLASLAYLDAEGPVTQKRLAEHAATDVMMTSQVLRALEKRELVERLPDPADARSRLVTVTPAGAALAPRAIAVVEAVDREFFTGVPTPDLLRTLTALDQPR